jgi:4-amino-4-deoxychorismate lyase
MLVNGLPSDSISAEDRGLSYGDGVFRTLRVRRGTPLSWQHHYLKLEHDCDAIKITCPSSAILLKELQVLSATQPDCVAKIIITRGTGVRGYAASASGMATRIVSINPIPDYEDRYFSTGVPLHVCRIKLGHQPYFAGIKHLNRLENVIAATECQESGTPEGLLEDEDGLVISGTRSNLFVLRDGALHTPDLGLCGVAGVQRDRVMGWAKEHGVACKIAQIRMDELLTADELFLVNSVFGLWPISDLLGYHRTIHPVAWKIQQWLNNENH